MDKSSFDGARRGNEPEDGFPCGRQEDEFSGDEMSRKVFNEFFDWLEALVFSIVLVVFIFTFIFRIVGVEGWSMEDTLHDRDRVIISDLFYTPRQGDIVVLNQPNFSHKPFIKRVIALGGQTVDIDYGTGRVLVDGEYLEEDYTKEEIRKIGDVSFPLTVPEGKLFVMGDNRNESTDSRSSLIGTVDERYVMGGVIVRIYPLNKMGKLNS